MKTSYCSLRLLQTLGLILCCAPHLSLAQDPGAQSASPQPSAPPTSSTASSLPDGAAKAAERKRRFEEEKKRLEGDGPRPQTSSQSAAQDGNCQASPDDLMLSPNFVNMLVRETQRFSLFDFAGHKLTSQADWSVSDSSIADLAVEGGVPVLTSKRTGTIHVTARVAARSVEATINVITPQDMKPGTVHWSSPSTPCTKPVGVVPAVGSFWPYSAPVATASVIASSIPGTMQPVASAQNPPPLLSAPPVDEDASRFIALRYDKSHVIFRLGEEGDFFLDQDQEKALRRLQGPVFRFGDERYFEQQKSLPGAQAWELGPKLLQSVRRNFEDVRVGEQWQLELSADSRIPVVVQKPVAVPWGCDNSSYTAAFIAEAAPQAQSVLAASPRNYFLVRKSLAATGPKSSQKPMPVGLLPGWNPTPEVRAQIEQAIDAQLRDELAHEQGRGVFEEVRKQFEEKAGLGKVKLTYEMQALQVSPDGFPLLLVRARWMADERLGLLMTLWLHVGSIVTSEHVDEIGNRAQWFSGKAPLNAGTASFDQLPYVLNVFDRGDGYGEILVYLPGYEGFMVRLYRYTPKGLVATKISIGDGC